MPHFPVKAALIAVFVTASSQAIAQVAPWDIQVGERITWEHMEQLRRNIFETFDKDQDGALSTEEYDAFDKARAEAAAKEHDSLLMRSVSGFGRENTDRNLDGKVTRAEMEQSMREWFDKADRNGDGVLSKGEY